jgi:hypothetical protein
VLANRDLQKAIPLVALRARSHSLRPSQAKGEEKRATRPLLTPFQRKGVAPQARGDVRRLAKSSRQPASAVLKAAHHAKRSISPISTV